MSFIIVMKMALLMVDILSLIQVNFHILLQDL
jgi:hypothetical protein